MDYGNRTLVAAPALELTGAQFAYREAPWIEGLIRVVVAVCGAFLVMLAWRSGTEMPIAFALLFVLGAGAMIYGAIYLHSRHSPNFIGTVEGLYFPERRPLARSPRLWLFVPWQNVLDCRVERMLDETSSRGLMLAIRATAREKAAFFSGCHVYRLAALRQPHTAEATLIGFSTFLPRPETVLEQLQRLAAGGGATTELSLDRAT